MLIGFTGAQSTGKTTLLKECKSKMSLGVPPYSNFEFVDEVTRKVRREGHNINEHGDDTTQLFILSEHLINHNIKYSCILDRCILDGYIYTKWLEDQNKVSPWVREYSCRLLTHLVDKLDIIFYTQPEDIPLIKNDGVRSNNMEFRQDIINLYEELFSQSYYWMNKVVRLRGSVEDRMNTIYDNINEKTDIRQQQNKQTSRQDIRV